MDHESRSFNSERQTLRWVIDVAETILGQMNQVTLQSTNDIIGALSQIGFEDIPGLKDGDDRSSPDVQEVVQREFGKRLGRCFRDSAELDLGDILVSRTFHDVPKARGTGSHKQKQYSFERVGDRTQPDCLSEREGYASQPPSASMHLPSTTVEPPSTAVAAVGQSCPVTDTLFPHSPAAGFRAEMYCKCTVMNRA